MNSDDDTTSLAARAAISDLINQYAFNVRHGLGAQSGKLFAEDAAFEVRYARFETGEVERLDAQLQGRGSIAEYLTAASERGRLCPVISNLIIEVQGDRAESSSVMSMLLPAEHNFTGEYRDTFIRDDDGEWRFSSRIFTIYL